MITIIIIIIITAVLCIQRQHRALRQLTNFTCTPVTTLCWFQC